MTGHTATTGHTEDDEVRVLRGSPTADELTAAIVAVRVLSASRNAAGDGPLGSSAGRLRHQNVLRRWPTERGRGAWRRSGWLGILAP